MAAEITVPMGVIAGFDMYLCLWVMVADTRVARVCYIQIFQPR